MGKALNSTGATILFGVKDDGLCEFFSSLRFVHAK
jgi:hypothetical protein